MITICNPTHCQPNRRHLLHLNHHTHALTTNTHDQHQHLLQFTTDFQLKSNIPYVLYTSFFFDKDRTTTLLHLAPPTRPKRNQERRTRAANTLPTSTRTIILSTASTSLHQHTTFITAAHSVLTIPQPRHIPWNIMRPISTIAAILKCILATLRIQTTYPLWTSSICHQPTAPTTPPTVSVRGDNHA